MPSGKELMRGSWALKRRIALQREVWQNKGCSPFSHGLLREAVRKGILVALRQYEQLFATVDGQTPVLRCSDGQGLLLYHDDLGGGITYRMRKDPWSTCEMSVVQTPTATTQDAWPVLRISPRSTWPREEKEEICVDDSKLTMPVVNGTIGSPSVYILAEEDIPVHSIGLIAKRNPSSLFDVSQVLDEEAVGLTRGPHTPRPRYNPRRIPDYKLFRLVLPVPYLKWVHSESRLTLWVLSRWKSEAGTALPSEICALIVHLVRGDLEVPYEPCLFCQ
jgi:hypothetical protein